jgi:predicted dehydrogenase
MLKRDDIDAVDILVPIDENYIVSETVAKAGKDFICEKPEAPTWSRLKKYLELSKSIKSK